MWLWQRLQECITEVAGVRVPEGPRVAEGWWGRVLGPGLKGQWAPS